MQSIDGRPVYAATDLVAYLACEHLTALERAAMAGLVDRPSHAQWSASGRPLIRIPACVL